MNRIVPVMLLCHLLSPLAMADDWLGLQLVESRRIWDQGQHAILLPILPRLDHKWSRAYRLAIERDISQRFGRDACQEMGR